MRQWPPTCSPRSHEPGSVTWMPRGTHRKETTVNQVARDLDSGQGGVGGKVTAVAAFFALVSLGMLALLAQWFVMKLTQPAAHMDIGEWPFVITGAVLALLPLVAAVGLIRRRPLGARLGWVSAYLIAIVGGLALLMALAQLTMGVAWTLLLGGGLMLIGAVLALRVLTAVRSERAP